MKNRILTAVWTALFILPLNALLAQEFKPLLNGKDLTGWTTFEKAAEPFWKMVDGVLVGENNPERHGSVLYTEQTYHDVIFEADVKWSKGADTGVMLRLKEPLAKADDGKDKATFYFANQLQVQIGTSGSMKRDMTGSLYVGGTERYPEKARGSGVEQLLLPEDWNHIRFEARGDVYKVWINGKQVTEYTDARFPGRAPLGLQVHPGNVMKAEFRNIRVKALD
jgi:hypothetical protein